jgi:alkylhydroperoxidase family enzyme
MAPYLDPVERPKGLMMKLLYFFLRRQFGKAPAWLTVFSARMPLAYTTWLGKVNSLNKKLTISQDTMTLIRARVDGMNMCTWCMDAGRWSAMKNAPHTLPKLDVITEYRTSPLFSEAERAALDFATELTEDKHVSQGTFDTLKRYYSEREICEIDWIVATNHLFNISNHGLNIGSDGLCEIRRAPQNASSAG